ncbi:hypothetical protein CRE_22961 [Caenorhabditis remanei]|uniref:F-box domain-containing protein n=1 Tax=Caenorhabditis remanei TaxID=31234 RepID=E3MW18_CAERE|nr:hypothetical protein CRE_22961 [Caenorhabditis remanei]
MSQPLKLFHLPTLVLRNVLQLLNPIELFELSQCSRRALSIIPLSNSKYFKLRMNNNYSSILVNDHAFRVRRNYQWAYILHGTRTFKGSAVKVSYHSEQELGSFWDDRIAGLKAVLFHLSNIFHCPIDCTRLPPGLRESIIDFISGRQTEIKELDVGGRNLIEEHRTNIFDKIRANSKSMIIFFSYWVTLEHLNLMKSCIVITLFQTTLTENDMTEFLKSWQRGEFPNLEYFYIRSKQLNKNFTAFGLPSLQDSVNPQKYAKTILGSEREIYGGVDVQRDDGVVAKVCFNNENGDLQILVL